MTSATRRLELGPLARNVGYVVRRAQLLIFQDFLQAMARHDIRPGQFSVLSLIGRNPGVKPGEVSEALAIKFANLVVLLDELAARGLARRLPAADDRRSRALFLTAKGERLLARLEAQVEAHERRVARALGPDGKEELLRLLGMLIADLEAGEAERELRPAGRRGGGPPVSGAGRRVAARAPTDPSP
jgi:DNA-binding MarR family transcriptional regulator